MSEDVSKLSFEDALQALEDIIDKLERGDAPLEQSIELYERGASLKAHCEAKLKAAQERIEKIVLDGSGDARAAPADLAET